MALRETLKKRYTNGEMVKEGLIDWFKKNDIDTSFIKHIENVLKLDSNSISYEIIKSVTAVEVSLHAMDVFMDNINAKGQKKLAKEFFDKITNNQVPDLDKMLNIDNIIKMINSKINETPKIKLEEFKNTYNKKDLSHSGTQYMSNFNGKTVEKMSDYYNVMKSFLTNFLNMYKNNIEKINNLPKCEYASIFKVAFNIMCKGVGKMAELESLDAKYPNREKSVYKKDILGLEQFDMSREGLFDWFKSKNKDENSLKAIKNKMKNINPSACSSLVNFKLMKAQYETIKAISNMSNIQIEKLKNIHNNIDKISNVKLKTKYYCEKNTEWYGEAINLVEDDNNDFYNIITDEDFDRLRDEVSNMDFYHIPIFPTLCYKDNILHVGSLAAYVYGLNIERPRHLNFNKVIHVMTDLIIEPEVGLNKFSLGSNEVTEILNLINGMKDEDFKISSVTCSGFLKPMFSVSDKYHAEFIAKCFDNMVKDFFKILNQFITDVEKEKELGTEKLEVAKEGLFEIIVYGPYLLAGAIIGGGYIYDKSKELVRKLLKIKDKAEVLKIENIEDPYNPSKAILKLCKHLGSVKEAINYINTLGSLKGRVYDIESMKNNTYYELAKYLKTKPVKNFKHVNFKQDKLKSELLENLPEQLHDFLIDLADTDKNKLKKIGFEDLGNLDIDSKEGHDKFIDKISELNTEVSNSLTLKVKNQEPLFIVPCNDRVYTFVKAIIEMEFKFNNKQWKTEVMLQTFTDCDEIDVDGISINEKDAEQLKECLNKNRENIEKLFHYNSAIVDGYNCSKWFKDDCFIGNEFITHIGCFYDDYEPYYFESDILGKFVKDIYPNAKNIKVAKEHLSAKEFNLLTAELDRQGIEYDRDELIFGNDRRTKILAYEQNIDGINVSVARLTEE